MDGSNTSGFQRTAVISLGGELLYNDSRVAVQTIGLEEDAGRAVRDDKQHDGERTYALDRLGTPLVEVALAPIEGSRGCGECRKNTWPIDACDWKGSERTGHN